MLRIPVEPSLIQWARARSRRDDSEFTSRFPMLLAWELGEVKPTWRQLNDFANFTHTPVGYLLLQSPPTDHLPIPDLRTIADRGVREPSPDLLDTIYLCQQRQDWYIDFATSRGLPGSPVVRSVTDSELPRPEDAANDVRQVIAFDVEERRTVPTWEDALRSMRSKIETAGVLVMISGIVGSNTHRPLDVEEFRGFTLTDPLAPLIFVNGKSSKSAQMFTLAHELGHVYLGQSGVSDADTRTFPAHRIEQWCNQLAAELLVPMSHLHKLIEPRESIPEAIRRLARAFKVSTVVILRRLHEAGRLNRDEFWREHAIEVERLAALQRDEPGGDYYRTQPARVGRRFAQAIIIDALEGRTLFRDAFKLLGVRTTATFNKLALRLGIDA